MQVSEMLHSEKDVAQKKLLAENKRLNTIYHQKVREIQRKLSLYGPHKDELVLLLNKKNIRDYGSQGQLKTMAIALKFAEFLYMADRLEQKPLLLLDDVFSELDWDRRQHLMHYLDNAGQVFLTSADEGMKFDTHKSIKYFSVEQGRILEPV